MKKSWDEAGTADEEVLASNTCCALSHMYTVE